MNEKEEEIKYFVSNASADVSIDNLLLAGFSRWREKRKHLLKRSMDRKAMHRCKWT